MRIAVIRFGPVAHFAPALNLATVLCSLGHNVVLIAHEVSLLPESFKETKGLEVFDLGPYPWGADRYVEMPRARKTLRDYLKTRIDDLDAVWTTTDISAREAGSILLECNHIMQLSELVEYVPLVMQRPLPLHSQLIKRIARNAKAIVVPEYNRGMIQKTWWNLPQKPFVLPNRSLLVKGNACEDAYASVQDAFKSEKRKILLFQGSFGYDRDIAAVANSLKLLDGEYVLYLMGRPNSEKARIDIERLCETNEYVRYVGFVPAPDHLFFTKYGYIGLLPYTPKNESRFPSLNVLFCAPNKIWDYAQAGLPMLGSDIPGLSLPFKEYDIGLTADLNNSREIADAIVRISEKYDQMSKNCDAFYNSVDNTEIVKEVLNTVGAQS